MPRESILNSTGMGTGIQFTLNHAFKIAPGAIAQYRALEDSSADAKGQARSGANRETWGQAVRGESDFGRPCRRRSRDTGRAAIRAGSFNILTADGTVQGISRRQCRIVHRPAKRLAWMQPRHLPAAGTAAMRGTHGPALLLHLGEGASCQVSR